MGWIDDLSDQVDEIFSTDWDERDGNVIPESEDVALKNGAVRLDATFLYADLAGSSRFSKLCPWGTTAKIIRAYLACSTRLILAYEGKIRSFDGDRVMGVFHGEFKNTHATSCAREIDWVVEKLIGPKATETFKSVRKNGLRVRHCVGIDTGVARAVRAGVRDNNDLIWIGRPPSLSARLSEIRNYPYCVYISEDSYRKLPESSKQPNGEPIWEERSFKYLDDDITIYRTRFTKTP